MSKIQYAIMMAVSTLFSGTQVAETYSRRLDRKPNFPLANPKTFERAHVTLGFADNCFKWEIKEYDRGKPMGIAPVTCRQKCPPGYGTNMSHCIWQESFLPYTRVLGLGNPDCANDDKVDSFKIDGKSLSTQLKETGAYVSEGTGVRRSCTTKCPETLGWATDAYGNCKFKGTYARMLKTLGMYETTCADHWEVTGSLCAQKCAAGFIADQKSQGTCKWNGKRF